MLGPEELWDVSSTVSSEIISDRRRRKNRRFEKVKTKTHGADVLGTFGLNAACESDSDEILVATTDAVVVADGVSLSRCNAGGWGR